nr:hypothetical protein [Rhodovulum sp. ES.010]
MGQFVEDTCFQGVPLLVTWASAGRQGRVAAGEIREQRPGGVPCDARTQSRNLYPTSPVFPSDRR